jgi:hypothetical protein
METHYAWRKKAVVITCFMLVPDNSLWHGIIDDALESHTALGFKVSGAAGVSSGSRKARACFLAAGAGHPG